MLFTIGLLAYTTASSPRFHAQRKIVHRSLACPGENLCAEIVPERDPGRSARILRECQRRWRWIGFKTSYPRSSIRDRFQRIFSPPVGDDSGFDAGAPRKFEEGCHVRPRLTVRHLRGGAGGNPVRFTVASYREDLSAEQQGGWK
jgi:hypothetical protein